MAHGPMSGLKIVGKFLDKQRSSQPMLKMHPLGDADPLKVIKVAAKDGKTGQDIQLHYSNYKVAGNGSFGVVYQAKLLRTGDEIAIKKVLQDRRFKVQLQRSLPTCLRAPIPTDHMTMCPRIESCKS